MIIASSPGGWREYNDLVIREFSRLTQYQSAPHQQNSATSKRASECVAHAATRDKRSASLHFSFCTLHCPLCILHYFDHTKSKPE
jgi:hypothetical protein